MTADVGEKTHLYKESNVLAQIETYVVVKILKIVMKTSTVSY